LTVGNAKIEEKETENEVHNILHILKLNALWNATRE